MDHKYHLWSTQSINNSSKPSGYSDSMQKSILFLYNSNKQSGIEIKEKSVIYNSIKNIK